MYEDESDDESLGEEEEEDDDDDDDDDNLDEKPQGWGSLVDNTQDCALPSEW